MGGNSKLLGGNSKLLGGNSKLLGGNSKLLGGNSKLLGGNSKVIISCLYHLLFLFLLQFPDLICENSNNFCLVCVPATVQTCSSQKGITILLYDRFLYNRCTYGSAF